MEMKDELLDFSSKNTKNLKKPNKTRVFSNFVCICLNAVLIRLSVNFRHTALKSRPLHFYFLCFRSGATDKRTRARGSKGRDYFDAAKKETDGRIICLAQNSYLRRYFFCSCETKILILVFP